MKANQVCYLWDWVQVFKAMWDKRRLISGRLILPGGPATVSSLSHLLWVVIIALN